MNTTEVSLPAATIGRVENVLTKLRQLENELADILSDVKVVPNPGTPLAALPDDPVRTATATRRGPQRNVPAGKFDPALAGKQLVEQLREAEGGAWTGLELESKFDFSSAFLHRRRKEHRIVYWRDAKHDFHYPKWQFTPAGALLPGVQEVLQIFRSADEWRLMSYFLGQRQQLGGRRPVDLLRAGEKDKVLAHAKLHADENTW